MSQKSSVLKLSQFVPLALKPDTAQYNTNIREIIVKRAASKASVWKSRAQRMDKIIQEAHSRKLPIRIILLDGLRRSADGKPLANVRVTKRSLDPVPWAVTEYDSRTGKCTLTRGAVPGAEPEETCDPELDAFEGAARKRFIIHRKRERKLRIEKIAEALRLHKGRLVCEVPKCNFDFGKVYGAIGNRYAQVHHKKPLSEAPKEGLKTKLSDLAIVCANCHAMIHLGGECRDIDALIP